MDARDAEPVRFAHGCPQRRQLLGARRFGHQPRYEVDGVVLQDSGRLARSAILHDDPRLWIPRLTGDAGKLQRLGIGPGDVAVFARDEHRAVVYRAVENLPSGRVRRRQQPLVAVSAEEPGCRGLVFGVMAKFGFEIPGGSCGGQIQVFERQRAAHELHARVVQPRQDGRAVCVEHDGLGAAQAFDLAIRSDPQYLVAADRHGFLKVGAATGINLAVDDDEVDGAIGVIALRADDEPGDEGGTDDDGNKNGRKARRHFREYSVASRAVFKGGKDEG